MLTTKAKRRRSNSVSDDWFSTLELGIAGEKQPPSQKFAVELLVSSEKFSTSSLEDVVEG